MCINAPQGKCVKTKTVSGGKKKMEREVEIYKKYYILLKFMQRKEAMVPPKTTKLTKISHFNN